MEVPYAVWIVWHNCTLTMTPPRIDGETRYFFGRSDGIVVFNCTLTVLFRLRESQNFLDSV